MQSRVKWKALFSQITFFQGDVYFKEVNINQLSGVSWEKLLKLLVYKNETDLKLSGTKTFTNDFAVEKLIETDRINGILIENIFTKTGKQDLRGPITIKGDVVVEKLDVTENFNQVPIKYISDNLVISNNTYTITGEYTIITVLKMYKPWPMLYVKK